jgi:hypothetical protein
LFAWLWRANEHVQNKRDAGRKTKTFRFGTNLRHGDVVENVVKGSRSDATFLRTRNVTFHRPRLALNRHTDDKTRPIAWKKPIKDEHVPQTSKRKKSQMKTYRARLTVGENRAIEALEHEIDDFRRRLVVEFLLRGSGNKKTRRWKQGWDAR